MSSSAATVRRGSCTCSSVKYEITGDPLFFYICHCEGCKRLSGGPMKNVAAFKPDKVVVTQGEDLLSSYTSTKTTSGNPIIRSWCSKCGNWLYGHVTNSDFKGVNVGTIDDPFPWRPQFQLFADQKRDWVGPIDVKKSKYGSKL